MTAAEVNYESSLTISARAATTTPINSETCVFVAMPSLSALPPLPCLYPPLRSVPAQVRSGLRFAGLPPEGLGALICPINHNVGSGRERSVDSYPRRLDVIRTEKLRHGDIH
jgi:hypothetical protein